ncbi:MAG: hypothetical protein HYX74_00215 [Acidobacteria bacterium]|nr:hypothetical protein [Acidobacteriota bacterium]
MKTQSERQSKEYRTKPVLSADGTRPMSVQATCGARWAVLLAGGEGERLRQVTEPWLGHHRPKQYCTFVGSRSMLQHTADRASRVVPAKRTITVIGRGHDAFLDPMWKSAPAGKIVEQPFNRDTAPGVFLPISYIMSADPEASVLLFPSDHFIHPEARFIPYLEHAIALAERLNDHLVLLGAVADRPEPDYGWIEPGAQTAGARDHFPVARFLEKPSPSAAETFYRHGHFWNTMIVAAKVRCLWSLGHKFLPDMMRRFECLRQLLKSIQRGAVAEHHEKTALAHVYRYLQPANFSRDLLQPATRRMVVIPMEGISWSDWGRPTRIVESLAKLGKKPVFGAHGSPKTRTSAPGDDAILQIA